MFLRQARPGLNAELHQIPLLTSTPPLAPLPGVNSPDAKPFVASTPPLAYRTGLFFVVLGMIVLPIIYLALTALACWWVWHFATHYFLGVWQWPIGHSRYVLLIEFVCSFTPLLVGGAIALAMIKPLFAPAWAAHATHQLPG